MKDMRVSLTERFVKVASAGERASPIFMDDAVIGFGVQVRRNGRKTFTFDYTFEARRRRATIGDHPVWAVAAAREEAKRLKREVDSGRDPLATRDARWEAATVRDLVARYIAEHAARLVPEARRTQISMLETHVLPAWGDRKVMDIRTGDVDALLADIARGRARRHKAKTRHRREKPLAPAKPTPVQANRVGAVIRKMFNLAIRWELRTDNPAKAFLRNPEHEALGLDPRLFEGRRARPGVAPGAEEQGNVIANGVGENRRVCGVGGMNFAALRWRRPSVHE